MKNSINYIAVEVDYSHRDFRGVIAELEKFGFRFYCIHRMTLEFAEMYSTHSNIIRLPIDGYECRGTLNADRFSDELINVIRQNHCSNGGCITHYTISE